TVAQVNLAGRRCAQYGVQPVASPNQHEIRRALPVFQADAIARRVKQCFGLVYLAEIVAQMRPILQRRMDGGNSGDVNAVDRPRQTDRLERVGMTRDGAKPQSREPEDRKSTRLNSSHEW